MAGNSYNGRHTPSGYTNITYTSYKANNNFVKSKLSDGIFKIKLKKQNKKKQLKIIFHKIPTDSLHINFNKYQPSEKVKTLLADLFDLNRSCFVYNVNNLTKRATITLFYSELNIKNLDFNEIIKNLNTSLVFMTYENKKICHKIIADKSNVFPDINKPIIKTKVLKHLDFDKFVNLCFGNYVSKQDNLTKNKKTKK